MMNATVRRIYQRICQLILLSLLFLSFAGCGLLGTELEFETIEKEVTNRDGNYYTDKQPDIIVVAKTDDLHLLEDFVLEESLDRLRSLDYDTYFAVGVYQGSKPTSDYTIEIERILKRGKRVGVYVAMTEPEPDQLKLDVITAPYHLVLVTKDGAWNDEFAFDMIVDGEALVSTMIFIP